MRNERIDKTEQLNDRLHNLYSSRCRPIIRTTISNRIKCSAHIAGMGKKTNQKAN
jgi:hypothetical protein